MKELSVKEVEYIAFRLAKELMAFHEPIPDFSSRFPNVLESCLAAPFYTFSGKSVYEGIIRKAAVLFYVMIKNHPFQNGNKRIAMTTLLVFLHKNSRWLTVDAQEFYTFTIWVAQSPAKCKEEILTSIEKFIKRNLVLAGKS